jgi:GNAT superfamily N-acetyltransferase
MLRSDLAKAGARLEARWSAMQPVNSRNSVTTAAKFPSERLAVSTLAERPELRAQLFSAEFGAAVPEFMRHDPAAGLYYADKALDRYLDFALAAVDRDAPDRVIARGFSVPFAFRDGTAGRNELPLGGWDAVIGWADADWRAGRRATAVSALEIIVLPPYRGRGIAQLMLEAMIANMWARGFGDLYAPLRPSDKHKEPLVPFADYVERTRGDGLPYDGWLRVHVRAGARIVKIAPCSMVIAGTLAEWSGWAGIDFDRSGAIVVPGALSPVHVSAEHDHAVYVEPNLWVHHRV